jgi:hypothetical protein
VVWVIFAVTAVPGLVDCARASDFGARSHSVHGRVLSSDGEPVRGAAVQIENTVTLNVRSFITNRRGKYHFAGLYSNVDYRLWAEFHGAFGPSKILSRFDAKKSTTIDLTVDPP